ncbi:MAG: PDZ domain-containing protein, partial [Planctomycetes bacterium]|nr:PDZ domain-containing protein [Planctomycetota bacterium]
LLAIEGSDGVRRGATLTPVVCPDRVLVRDRTGLVTRLLSPSRAWRLGLEQPRGVLVVGVLAAGPGAEVGVQTGDVLTHVGLAGGAAQAINSPGELASLLRGLPPRAEISITVSRGGRAFRGRLRVK